MDGDNFSVGDQFYQIGFITEVDIKNPYLDISMGYGSFDIGRTISSSIILNNDVNPYGYLKFHKRFGILEYNGITTQLIPDSLAKTTQENKPYLSKSMAIQTVSLHWKNASFGLGNSIIYGDKTIDLAYSTPLGLYKAIDTKQHGRDNILFYGFGEVRPISGLNIYANFLFDDLRNERWKTPEYLSYSAYQLGIIGQLPSFPLEIGTEATVVGPSTYGHKTMNRENEPSLTYMQDNRSLGHRNGANFLSFVTRARVHIPRATFSLSYENIQQGDKGNSASSPNGELKFLADNISRYEIYKADMSFRVISELHLFSRYEYDRTHYIYTGAEFKY
jgi:hypothetical protein